MELKKFSDTINAVLSIGASVVMIGGFIWFFIDDEVSARVAKFTGAAAAIEASEKTTEALGKIVEKLDVLDTRITALEPSNRIFQTDELRSLVHDACPSEGFCTYTYRVRRTEIGANCDPPSFNRYVVDKFGTTHPVEAATDKSISRGAGRGWTDLTNVFKLPDAVPEGIAEFYIETTYTGCFDDDPTRKVRERTPHLIFHVDPS